MSNKRQCAQTTDDDGTAYCFVRNASKQAAVLPPSRWGTATAAAAQPPVNIAELLDTDPDKFLSACNDCEVPLEDLADEFDASLRESHANKQAAAAGMQTFERRYTERYGRAPQILADKQPVAEAGGTDLDAPASVARLLDEALPATNSEPVLRRLLEDPRVLMTEPPQHTAQRQVVQTFEAACTCNCAAPPRPLVDWLRELRRWAFDEPDVEPLGTDYVCLTLRLDDALFATCVLARGNSTVRADMTPQQIAERVPLKFMGFLFCQSVRSHARDCVAASSTGTATSP